MHVNLPGTLRYRIGVVALFLLSGISGCVAPAGDEANPDVAYNPPYYPTQAPFYAGASPAVTLAGSDIQHPGTPPVVTRANGCRRHPRYHAIHDLPVTRVVATPSPSAASYPQLFAYPTATRGYDWNYWRHNDRLSER